MGFLKPKSPKPPKPPDPNVQLGAEAKFNRYNVTSPFGTQTWSQGPGGAYTLSQSLDPSQQRQFNIRNQIGEQMLGQAGGVVGQGAPGFSDLPLAPSGKFDINAGGNAAGKAYFENQRALLDPEFAKADVAFQQEMSNKGIPMGSEAWNEALRQHENNKNFALNQASGAATTLGADLALRERGQQQADYGQQTNIDLAKRGDYRDQIAQLLGGQTLTPLEAGGAGPLDVGGAYNAQNQAILDQYNARTGTQNSLLSGLFGLGSAYLGSRCERFLKRCIHHVYTLASGLPLYLFKYLTSDLWHFGPMADEAASICPEVIRVDGLFRRVSMVNL